ASLLSPPSSVSAASWVTLGVGAGAGPPASSTGTGFLGQPSRTTGRVIEITKKKARRADERVIGLGSSVVRTAEEPTRILPRCVIFAPGPLGDPGHAATRRPARGPRSARWPRACGGSRPVPRRHGR